MAITMIHYTILNLLSFISMILMITPFTTSSNTIEVTDRLQQLELEIRQLNRKTVHIEHKNVDQDQEIRFLKTIISTFIKKYYSNKNCEADSSTLMKQKRAFRMIQPSQNKPVFSAGHIPSNCNDLNNMGHTLNGIYLVKDAKTIVNGNFKSDMLNAVFCNFQQPSSTTESSSDLIETKLLGYLNVRSSAAPSSGVYFYVVIGKISTYPDKNGLLRFDRQVLNVGFGMDFKTGVFTVPKSGIYTFSFSLMKSAYTFTYTEIALRLNAAKIGQATSGSGLFTAPVALQSTLKLKKGDRIDLQLINGEIHHACEVYCHHFTGWLLEEHFE